MEQKFKEKVQSMSAKQIIMAMVEGLKKEHLKINMNTFGYYDDKNKICFGCAATNTLCEISGNVFNDHKVYSIEGRSNFLNEDLNFVDCFEEAINALRMGVLDSFEYSGYNYYAEQGEFAIIKEIEGLELPYLDNENYKEDLHFYERLAELQD